MKISKFTKALFFVFVAFVLMQFLTVTYHLMNKPDSYLANLGSIATGSIFFAILYCIYNVIKLGSQYVREQIEKDKQN